MKLKYFAQHGWAMEWIKTAEDITQDEVAKYNTCNESTANVCA